MNVMLPSKNFEFGIRAKSMIFLMLVGCQANELQETYSMFCYLVCSYAMTLLWSLVVLTPPYFSLLFVIFWGVKLEMGVFFLKKNDFLISPET